MKTVIILHGMPSKEEYEKSPRQTEKHWIPWIKEQLIANGIAAEAPELPEPYEPNYEKWKKAFEQFPITGETILIGHSAGAGFLVRWLSENKVKVGKVILVAPWMDTENYLAKKYGHSDFFDFEIDPEFPSRTDGVVMFVSDDDESHIHKTIERIHEKCPNIPIKRFHDKGHFTLGDMGTVECPELLEEIISA